MRPYDYREAVLSDLTDWINENLEDIPTDECKALDYIQENAYNSDSVTGNGSGSYTFNAWAAEENLCHNYDLAKEALEEYCCDFRDYIDSPEAIDVIIRCYLLQEVASDALRLSNWEEGTKYNVYIWSGCGYVCDTYTVVANYDEEALYMAVAEAVNNLDRNYLSLEEYDDLDDDAKPDYIYIDATREGANEPVYIRAENLRIEAA